MMGMGRLKWCFAFLMGNFTIFAQVGVGTPTPQAALDVVSSDSGIILPRVVNTSVVTAPVNGMVVYDLSSNCLKGFQGGGWTGCGFTIPTETSPTGKVWMARNLGSSRVATSSTDPASYGDLYQWGRTSDGHQLRASGTTTVLASGSSPGHGNFIITSSTPFDWLTTQDDTLWQGVNGVNNPCPTGYRLPTEAEWNAERMSWTSDNAAGAYSSVLRLPTTGYRHRGSANLVNVGTNGAYWSSTVSGTQVRAISFSSTSTTIANTIRSHGFSVRCIKN